MRWIVFIIGGLALVAFLVVLIGGLLPKAHSVSRTVRIALAPDALLAPRNDGRVPEESSDGKESGMRD